MIGIRCIDLACLICYPFSQVPIAISVTDFVCSNEVIAAARAEPLITQDRISHKERRELHFR